ncbi:MAG: hypothetical protein Q9219_000528 [cf. Caloplaca sp. 3 TL-2023]
MILGRTILCLLTARLLVQAAPPIHPATGGPLSGDSDPDDSSCSDFNTCGSKGYRDWQALKQKVAQANPKDKESTEKIFDTDYRCEFISMGEAVQSVRDDLANHGFEWDWVEGFGVWSTNPRTGKDSKETAYINLFYTSKGLIVADENYRAKDEQKTLHWSELMYHAWKVAEDYDNASGEADIPPGHPGGGAISTLQTVVRVSVQNVQTLKVLRTIRNAKGDWPPYDERWHKFVEDEETKYWFYALMGTVNVQSVVWLLRDHAAEIGKKIITEIWVRWDSVDPDIWINLGPAI